MLSPENVRSFQELDKNIFCLGGVKQVRKKQLGSIRRGKSGDNDQRMLILKQGYFHQGLLKIELCATLNQGSQRVEA